ncbi:hypothetical protein [Methanoplanus limicola]|uniref:Uncharacterized protein n=1 Tax=Methanoplanus limicola DSM 2279 TaxID=937775 RepID=H1YY17_9EURY|nr:hypothetical protein [Methanoplanus limicola]EHQ36952.1 hypothetical protein Metlim_2919 [Methanoplanus limicola DSM 2279]
MDEDLKIKIAKAFEEAGITDMIQCQQAFDICEKYDIRKIDIARFCNANSIKIRKCQLGCFK